MTVQAVRRPRRRAVPKSALPAPSETLAIGEIDQTLFDCPSCSRPLALGTRRCPGCRTRLVAGVVVGKVSLFAAAGLVVGLVVGGGAGFVLGSGGPAGAAGGAVAAAGSSADAGSGPANLPTATTTASSPSIAPSRTAPPTTPPDGITPSARAALGQAVGTNQRLAATATLLRAELTARSFDPSEVARLLRSVSADSLTGEQLAARIGAWWGTAAAGAGLGTYYRALHDSATDALVASVRNVPAYRSAATVMVGHLDELSAVDAAIQAAARSAGVSLPATSAAGGSSPAP
jgi:hypothetical protein